MIRTLLIAILALTLSACDALDAQVTFREEASFFPANIFRTDDGVNPIGDEDDADDWRTAPLYAGKFLVTQRAHPNPASRDEVVSIVVRISGFNVLPGGLRLVARSGDGRRETIAILPEATTDGSYSVEFFPGESLLLGQPGLYRLILFDSRSEPVTYGDLLVQ